MKNLLKTNKKPLKSGIKMWITLTSLVVVTIGALSFAVFNALNSDEVIVAVVNNQPIDIREFRLVAQQERVELMSELGEDYAEKGVNLLRERTLEKLVEIKVQQQWMADEKLISDSGYASFYEEWQQENERRQAAIKQGEVVYGATAYTLEQYYQLRQDKGVLELQKAWASTRLVIAEAQIREYYNNRPEAFIFTDAGQKKPFEEVAPVIENRLVNEKYLALVEKETEAALVEVREEVIKKVIFD